jgi:hypothetical protein
MNNWGPRLYNSNFLFIAALCAFLFGATHPTRAQSNAVSSDTQTPSSPLHFQISVPKTTFHVGELIPIDLLFSADAPGAFRIYKTPFDRVPAGIIDRLVVEPADAAPEREQPGRNWRRTFVGGDPNRTDPLTPAPVHVRALLNKWLVLSQPGTFRLHIESDRVVADVGERADPPPFHMQSNAIEITIVSASPTWQADQLKDILHVLDTTKPLGSIDERSERADAIYRLLYLDTDASTCEMVRQFGKNLDPESSIYESGLFESTHHSAAIDEMNRLLDDRDFSVSETFATTLSALPIERSDDGQLVEQKFAENEVQVLAKLIDALPSKRGDAFTDTFATLERIRRDNGLDEPVSREIVGQLIGQFGKLGPGAQLEWLRDNWDDVKDSAWLDTLRSAVLSATVATPGAGQSDDIMLDRSLMAASALTRWHELDPVGSRDAILAQITSPEPQFNSATLGLLPDKKLPTEQQQQIAQNFANSPDAEAASWIAGLVYRYTDAAVWPVISGKVSQSLVEMDCVGQAQMIAFAIRVGPDQAAPLLDAALAPRDGDDVSCAPNLITNVAELQNDPLLEKAAIALLNDPDLSVVENAGRYLEKYGSAAAEDPLWQRFQSWSGDWAARNTSDESAIPDNFQLISVGIVLAQALVHGPGWLADKEKLERVESMSGGSLDNLNGYTTEALELWSKPPLTIHCRSENSGDGDGFQFGLAQYSLNGLKALQDKLGQFPNGATLLWDSSNCVSAPNYNAAYSAVAAAVSINGITLKPAPPPDPATLPNDPSDSGELVTFSGSASDRVVVVE